MSVSPPHRPSLPSSGDDSSPFSLLKSHCGTDQGLILRTKSLDEANRTQGKFQELLGHHHSEHEDTTVKYSALHSSFDASLLEDHSGHSLFGDDEERVDRSRSDSWDDDCSEMSGRKHTRPRTAETLELNPPGTIRKQPRRAVRPSKTPALPLLRPVGPMKKPASNTSSSAIKRRRAPLPQRQSPMRRMPPSTSFQASVMSPPSTTVKLENSIFGAGLNGSYFAPSPPALTPSRQSGPFGTAKSMSKWHNTHATGTTAASSILETTLESSDSVDTSSPTTTRFRFTSFPASLPRVNNPKSRECPNSVRKRMPFAPTPAELNHSREDDGTHNTSISSLSAEGHHQHLPHVAGSIPPAILHLNPRAEKGEEDNMRPVHAKLFADDEDDNFGYSDDDTADSPVRDIAGRTRLNFNTVLSPAVGDKKTKASEEYAPMPMDLNMELSRPYDSRRSNSFRSSLSSNTHTNNMSNCEDPGSTLTPTRLGEKYLRPATPREVQLHFPLESECSPIPGMQEDNVEPCDMESASDDSGEVIGDVLIPRRTKVDCVDPFAKTDKKMREESSTESDSANGKSRRLRPMPDMTAFESNAVSSRGDRSLDDSATFDSKGVSSTQRVCPPTPQRTPAWATEGKPHPFYGRQNSLIATKVLLSAPSQVLEGRCSLENSILDDDSKHSIKGCARSCPPKKGSIQPMDEDFVGSKDNDTRPRAQEAPGSAVKTPKLHAPPRLMRRVPSTQDADSLVSFSTDFTNLGALGSGAFADVYKVRSIRDNRLYAVKRNRRQFRGKRDRDMALTEVQAMQRLQSVCAETGTHSNASSMDRNCLYLLFFYRAWQEDGYFLCQTELCCRDTCRELLDSLRFLWNTSKKKYPSLTRNLPIADDVEPGSMDDASGRLVPTETVWKICHDIAAGLSHIHSHGLVHHDIKPSNIFFVGHPRFGAMCKIGDFGMAGDIGSSADGLEGDTRYMPSELLSSGIRLPSHDIFSLGLTLYEIATDQQTELPYEGPRWHEFRTATSPEVPPERGNELRKLIQSMTDPNELKRPSASAILKGSKAVAVGSGCDGFLRDYIHDIEEFDRLEEERLAMDSHEDQTPRNGSNRSMMPVRSPSLSMLLPNVPVLLSPMGKCMQ